MSSKHFKTFEKIEAGVRTVALSIGFPVMMLVLGHYAIGAYAQLKASVKSVIQKGSDESRVDEVWADDLTPAELARYNADAGQCGARHVRPYYMQRRNPCHSETVNVDEMSRRVTLKPDSKTAAPGKTGKKKKVWCFGGSTMWGTGSPDSETIPSNLQKLFGDGYEFYNYGESAYVSAQELNLLLERLALGDRPDVVLFYDGANDTYAGAYSPGIPREPQWGPEDYEGPPTTTGRLLQRLFQKTNYSWLVERIQYMTHTGVYGYGKNVETRLESSARGTIDVYEQLMRQVRALGREYGFKAYFAWQPNLFQETKKHLHPYEQWFLDREKKVFPVEIKAFRRTYEIAKERLSGRAGEGVFFLSDVFNDLERPIYTDLCHVPPGGNRIIARAIFDLSGHRL